MPSDSLFIHLFIHSCISSFSFFILFWGLKGEGGGWGGGLVYHLEVSIPADKAKAPIPVLRHLCLLRLRRLIPAKRRTMKCQGQHCHENMVTVFQFSYTEERRERHGSRMLTIALHIRLWPRTSCLLWSFGHLLYQTAIHLHEGWVGTSGMLIISKILTDRFVCWGVFRHVCGENVAAVC